MFHQYQIVEAEASSLEDKLDPMTELPQFYDSVSVYECKGHHGISSSVHLLHVN